MVHIAKLLRYSRERFLVERDEITRANGRFNGLKLVRMGKENLGEIVP